MNIMDYMSRKATALLGVFGAAALGVYIESRRARRASSGMLEPQSSLSIRNAGHVDIDDDEAADIIRRARPALERARELYAY